MTDMHLSKDELARDARGLDRANDRAMAAQDALLQAALEQNDTADSAGRRRGIDALLSRRLFTISGFSVATAAVVAACSKATVKAVTPINGVAASTTSTPDRAVTDAVLLRTASSLEHNAIAVYDTVIGQLSGTAAEIGKLFVGHHRAHADALEKATKDLGGEPFTTPNPIVAKNVVDPAVAAAKTPEEILALAHAIESVATHTYQLMVAGLSAPALRSAIMSIGAVEARHAAIIAKAIGGLSVAGIERLQPPAATTTVAKDAVVAPTIYQVPGAFEPVGASSLVLPLGGTATLVNIDALGPNSYMYA
jgi:hypothetical protein